MFTPDQCRAGRALVNLSTDDLAKRARVDLAALDDFEAGQSVAASEAPDAIRRALEDAGVVFLSAGETVEGGAGVRLMTNGPTLDRNDREMIQYPEFLTGDGGPGSGG
ncbi:MAG: transcriptional regulator [Rhizobiaceae bacterium]|nr:transcriptional regulator [Rhizobiaceae bacterium]